MSDSENYGRLESILTDFSEQSNTNEKVQKLIKRWSSTVLIWPDDLGKGLILNVENGKIIEIKRTSENSEGKVKVVGKYEILSNMFLGKENLSHLYMDGVIQTFGSEKDQIVLDAIARILWK